MQFVVGQIIFRNRWSSIQQAVVIKASPRQVVIRDVPPPYRTGSEWTIRECDFKTLHTTKRGALIEQRDFCSSEVNRHQQAIVENANKIFELEKQIEAETI